MAEMSVERLREIRERLDGLLVAGIEDFELDAADLLAEVERLRSELAERDRLIGALTETAEWAFEVGGWRLWYYGPPMPAAARGVTNYREVAVGDTLKLRIDSRIVEPVEREGEDAG